MGLETAFYIIGIIFMSVMLLLIITLVVLVFVIRAKLNHIHDEVVNKLRLISTVADMGTGVLGKSSMVFGVVRKLMERRGKHAKRRA